MKRLNISHLVSGGIITNYFCSSKCRHCLYGCSPAWEKDFISVDMTRKSVRKILSLGCCSIHIGGGEPFLKPEKLLETVRVVTEEGMGIAYIETNSSWYQDHDSAVTLLRELIGAGVHTLLVSVSPFHNEYIPFKKVQGLLSACGEAGMNVFPWVQDFLPDLQGLDSKKVHSLEEYVSQYGANYIQSIPARYWLHFGGRSLYQLSELLPSIKTDEILKTSAPCRELSDTSHFHFDLFGNCITGLCSGLAVQQEHLGNPLDPEKYPFITVLYNEGIKGFCSLAEGEYGFKPLGQYRSKCHLCTELRKYIVRQYPDSCQELRPAGFYQDLDPSSGKRKCWQKSNLG